MMGKVCLNGVDDILFFIIGFLFNCIGLGVFLFIFILFDVDDVGGVIKYCVFVGLNLSFLFFFWIGDNGF